MNQALAIQPSMSGVLDSFAALSKPLEMGIRTLSSKEIELVSGGVDWAQIAEGVAILGGAIIAIAVLPEASLVGFAYGIAMLGSLCSGSGAGLLIANGLWGDTY